MASWIEASPLDRRQIVENWLRKFSAALEEKRFAAARGDDALLTDIGATC